MTENGATWAAFLGLTAIVGTLVAVLVFSVLRFAAAARNAGKNSGENRVENALLASALAEAITKLKAQERATAARAAATERMSGEIVASLTSGVLVVDREGRIQIANPAARRILALNDFGDSSDYRTVLRGAPGLADVVNESLHTNTPVSRRTVMLDTSRGPKHLGVTVSPLAVDGAPSGAICLFTDLTAVVTLEEQLRLKEALARLGELTAGLAHEFRNGLATIHGYSRLLDPEAVPPHYKPYVEGIRAEATALSEVVTNFLNFARPEQLSLTPVSLRALIARASEDVPAAKVVMGGDFGTVDGDDVLLRQAFSNLFRNSVDVCLATGVAPRIVVKGRIDPVTEREELEIADNGPGIPADGLARIFQPFFTMRPGGTGLGLSIVQKVIVSHNGSISAGNRPEGGAVFRITLPLTASEDLPKT